MSTASIWGLMAEFDGPAELVSAARELRERGYEYVEAYTPYPVEDLDEILGGWNPLPLMVLTGGCLGTATAWSMQYYIAAIDYPLNIGGRPLNSWPAFIVIMFELTVLFAAATAFFGSLLLCGLPRPHHPVFNVPRFAHASRDKFFLSVEAQDLLFEAERTADELKRLRPVEVWEVEDS
jgi:hypothetical protein